MRKILLTIMLLSSVLFGAFADAYGFRDFGQNAFLSPSYSDRLQDGLVNPAMLPKVDSDAIFYSTLVLSEDWDLDVLSSGEELSGIQNQKTEINASFVGKNLALTAYSATYFSNRRCTPSSLTYDIYNTLGIGIGWGARYKAFSFGVGIKGGSEMVRKDKVVSGYFNAYEHAFFSPFEHAEGRDFFSLGASLALDFDYVAASFSIEDLITIKDEKIYMGWDAILDSMGLSVSLRWPEFNKRGDLNLVRPRTSWSMTGNPAGHDLDVRFLFEMQFQLLPELDLSVAAGYREKKHGFFSFDPDNGLLMTSFGVTGESFAVSVLMNVSTRDWKTLYPALSVTLAR